MTGVDIRVIDIHTHLYPEVYLDALRARNEAPRLLPSPDGERFVIFPDEPGRRIDADWYDVERKLAFMQRVGIDQSVVSLGNPWLDPLPDSAHLARELNAEFAGLRDRTDGRLLGMGVLPGQDIGLAAEVAGRDCGDRQPLRGGQRHADLRISARRSGPRRAVGRTRWLRIADVYSPALRSGA